MYARSRSPLLSLVAPALSVLAFAAGCTANASESTGDASSASTPNHLTYYGGPLIDSVKVVAVYWGAANYQGQLNQFYPAVTNSAYLDWLSEYDMNGHTIGRGTFVGAFAVPAAPASMTDADVQSRLAAQIAAGTLPAPDGSTVYVNHFAPGVTITVGAAASCRDFCAYHGTIAHLGTALPSDVYYAVVPDLGGACSLGCGNGTTFDNTTMEASRELLATIVDPAVGIATALSAPIGWYDASNGDIGDGCAYTSPSTSLVAGYTVARGWSNKYGQCIAQTSDVVALPPPPTCSATALCGGEVDLTCSAQAGPVSVTRGGVYVGSLPQVGATIADYPGTSSASYSLCVGQSCSALSVAVNLRACGSVNTRCRGTTCF